MDAARVNYRGGGDAAGVNYRAGGGIAGGPALAGCVAGPTRRR